MNQTFARLFGICLICGILGITGLLGLPDSDDPEFKQKLANVNNQIKTIGNKLAKLKKEQGSLLNDIYGIELKYEKERVEMNKVKLQLDATRGKIKKKEKEKAHLETQVRQSRKKLTKILRILYKLGGNSYLKLFIRVDTIDQLFKNYRLFSSLISLKQEEIKLIQKNILRLNQVRKSLQKEYDAQQEFVTLRAQKIKNLKSLKRGKLSLIRKINNDKGEYAQLREELKYEAARLNEVLAGRKVKSSLRELNFNRIKGRLRWPLRGIVISTFGKKKSTRFNTYIINDGIKIRPTGSDEIKSVYSGDVAFSAYYKGYGKLVIVQHSRDLYSMYGHCEKLLKKKGDPVLAGEILAIAGSTGSVLGKALYFGVRVRAKAKDPMEWLQKKSRRR